MGEPEPKGCEGASAGNEGQLTPKRLSLQETGSEPLESPKKRPRLIHPLVSDADSNRDLAGEVIAHIHRLRERAARWQEFHIVEAARIRAKKVVSNLPSQGSNDQLLQRLQRGGCAVDIDQKLLHPPPMGSASEVIDAEEFADALLRAEEDNIIRKALEITRKNSKLARERLPKQPEAPRSKAHWDYLLDEMVWMATDFREERKWKISLARKVSKLIVRHFQEKDARQERFRREEETRLRRRANSIARDVRKFWSQISQLADYRASLYVEAQRREERDRQLRDLLGETQKISSMIAKDMMNMSTESTTNIHAKTLEEPTEIDGEGDDEDCTIASEEEYREDEDNGELVRLEQEANMSIEEILLQQGIDPAMYRNDAADYSADGKDRVEKSTSTTPEGTIDSSRNDKLPAQEDPGKSAQGIWPARNAIQVNNEGDEGAGVHRNKELLADLDGIDKAKQEDERVTLGAGHLQEDSKNGHGAHRIMPPHLLKGSLRDYQRDGLDWLAALYEKGVNGILADEMGLGKTIMTIALIAWLAIDKGNWGPHLVIAPTSVIINWEVEFKKWCPGLKIMTYHGNMKERRVKRNGWTRNNAFHVCITSYNLVVQDANIFRRKKWSYMILDEAQNIKNFQSQRWQTLLNFTSQRRLLLTGTPLQNSIMELWSLMHFLMPEVFRSHSEFKEWFSSPISAMVLDQKQGEDRGEILYRLHEVLRPFLLRRLKQDVERGLPPKFEHVMLCPLSKRQRRLYEDFMARSETQQTLEKGNFIGVMNVLMQLRKVCNHPDLFDGRPIVSPFIMPGLQLRVPASIILSTPPTYNYPLSLVITEWSTHQWSRLQVLCASHEIEKESILYEYGLLLSGIVSDPLAAVEMRRRFDRSANLKFMASICHRRCHGTSVCDVFLSSLLRTPSGVICNRTTNLVGFSYGALPELVNTLEVRYGSIKPNLLVFGICVTRVVAKQPEIISPGQYMLHHTREVDRLIVERESRPIRDLFGSASARGLVSFPDATLIQWDCGKFQVLVGLLRELKKRGSRCLIFTQMSKMLDILEQFLNLHSHLYLRLDGSTKTDERQRLTERFNSDPKYFCMILTTRAGGVGINLTGADTVIFYDSDWNPAMDAQAQDRVHRIGQTRKVHIYRLISERSVEENILRKANEKRTLEELVISQADFNTNSFRQRLDVLELVRPLKSDAVSPEPSNKRVSGGALFESASERLDQGQSGVGEVTPTGLDVLLLAVEDEHERESMIRAENERKMVEEEFEDHLPIQADTSDTELKNVEEERFRVEEALTSIQRYALCFLESSAIMALDHGIDICIANKKEEGEESPTLSAIRRVEIATKELERSDKEKEGEHDLLYPVDETEESYLKAMMGTDEDLKIYMPLRDGGPDELVMSTVVGGTAAAGLESAEDAAFFPHAYSRMGRTDQATRRQKERASQRKREELERRRREDTRKVVLSTPTFTDSKTHEQATRNPQPSPTVDLKKLTIVPPAMSISSAESRASAGSMKLKRPRKSTLEATAKAGMFVVPKVIVWTRNEDQMLESLARDFPWNPGLWSIVLNASTVRRAGLSPPKSTLMCEERHRAREVDSSMPWSDAEMDEKIAMRHVDAICLAAEKLKRRKSDSSKSNPVPCFAHSSHTAVESAADDVIGSGDSPLLVASELTQHMIALDHPHPGFKAGELPRALRKPVLRPPRDEPRSRAQTGTPVSVVASASPRPVTASSLSGSSKLHVSVSAASSGGSSSGGGTVETVGGRLGQGVAAVSVQMTIGSNAAVAAAVNSQVLPVSTPTKLKKKASTVLKNADSPTSGENPRSTTQPSSGSNLTSHSLKKKAVAGPSQSGVPARGRGRPAHISPTNGASRM
mmetsp:Transcript_971/g.2083  ORF Transcript_971/g.2083 Transcript_971/m.2083 type:complete len:1855 (-) Transcript_971:1156-6720(-)|eukprot:CAMPEP_0184689088 /NCGR_PEP_ID=MMETSP0312-20130426/30461_1 /TAXON_ID=31354 /ORGANISM="Compsopogon coeruleus, Strain SAG 36.94" /LENGTH=1854 /DNA_ID=CAMNT_0027146395 /DNA_START=1160 /DNA_END=6724 /DNA_ORIENTATION=-